MKKIINIKTGKVVHIGETVTKSEHKKTEHGEFHAKESCIVTEASLPYLIKNGFVKVVEEAEPVHSNVAYYLTKLGKIYGDTNANEMFAFLLVTYHHFPTVVDTMFLKTIAEELNRNVDMTRVTGTVWGVHRTALTPVVVSTEGTTPEMLKKAAIFRSQKHAEFAIAIHKKLLEHLKNGK